MDVNREIERWIDSEGDLTYARVSHRSSDFSRAAFVYMHAESLHVVSTLRASQASPLWS